MSIWIFAYVAFAFYTAVLTSWMTTKSAPPLVKES